MYQPWALGTWLNLSESEDENSSTYLLGQLEGLNGVLGAGPDTPTWSLFCVVQNGQGVSVGFCYRPR